MMEQFKMDVDKGLSASPKHLSSKYFYDKKGDALFSQIMHLPEYYVTRAELEIFSLQTQIIIDALQLNPNTYFELIELGAGDGLKTKELLRLLDKQKYKFEYIPLDISLNVLENLEKSINTDFPNIAINRQHGDYFHVLKTLKDSHHPKVVLFLGSNIGNMPDEIAKDFIAQLGANLNVNDKLFLGVDLIKSAEIVLPAYSDSKGVTKAFNLNLLTRINRELGGNFEIANFDHQAEYHEAEGVAKSFIVSKCNQEVRIENLDKSFYFSTGERIATEISRKYNTRIVHQIIEHSGFQITGMLSDRGKYFSNYILTKEA